MIKQLIVSILVFLLISAGSIAMWHTLKANDAKQVARVIEAQSYYSRSHLAKGLETLISDLENLHAFWTTYSQLPREQWDSTIKIEIEHIESIGVILWYPPEGNKRYLRSGSVSALDYNPTDEEWSKNRALIRRSQEQSESDILGPFLDSAGNPYFEIHLVESSHRSSGRLAATIDAERLFRGLLADQSPDFSILVSWGEVVLYQRDQPARDIPEDWTVAGRITSSLGGLWTVSLAPTESAVQAMTSLASDLILLLGLIIAVLIAVLVYEYGKTRTRAVKAESLGRELGTLNRGLEEVVTERTRALELRTHDLQTIADSVGHDMRNPLSAATMNTQLLQKLCEQKLTEKELTVL
ncbi:MAG: hypothetical protein WBS20_15590, partial [Lysobacterales bacterium]